MSFSGSLSSSSVTNIIIKDSNIIIKNIIKKHVKMVKVKKCL